MVEDVALVSQSGLFNPYTAAGTIVVNGVVATVHSRWFLDYAFDALGLTAHLPEAYQVCLPCIIWNVIKLYLRTLLKLDET